MTTITGSISTVGSITGSISVGDTSPVYDGEYVITPQREDVVLDTEKKRMSQNVTVKGVEIVVAEDDGRGNITIHGDINAEDASRGVISID